MVFFVYYANRSDTSFSLRLPPEKSTKRGRNICKDIAIEKALFAKNYAHGTGTHYWPAHESNFAIGNGAPGVIRTLDLVLRRHTLYPAELRARRTSDGETAAVG